jgi:hypothetical protein
VRFALGSDEQTFRFALQAPDFCAQSHLLAGRHHASSYAPFVANIVGGHSGTKECIGHFVDIAPIQLPTITHCCNVSMLYKRYRRAI